MRINRHQLWMGIAELAAKRSTCYRGNVGAVIVHGTNPVSIGYNGPASGEPHCQGNSCKTRMDGGCLRSIHAEDNAIGRLPPQFQTCVNTLDLYVTSSPCPSCSELVIDSGVIGRVYYQSPYRLKEGIGQMIDEGIEVYRLSPSGYLINERNGEVLEHA